MPHIRRYEARDAETCRAVLASVLPSYGLEPDWSGIDADLHDVEAVYLRSGGGFWVIEEAGRVAGMAGLQRVSAEVGEVRKMYFLPELRGLGFGRRMLDLMVAFAQRAGLRTLTLETNSVLREAIRLYERYGFTPDPALLHSCRCDLAYRLAVPPAP